MQACALGVEYQSGSSRCELYSVTTELYRESATSLIDSDVLDREIRLLRRWRGPFMNPPSANGDVERRPLANTNRTPLLDT